MSTAPTLFRARFLFVCDRCDTAYRGGRLAGWNSDSRLECAACLVGADPDNDPTTTGQDYPTCSTTRPPVTPAPSLFDDDSAAGLT